MNALLSLEHVSHTFNAKPSPVPALRDVNIDVHPGEMIALVGPSGSGKSTVLMIAGLMMRQSTGKTLIKGIEVPQKEKDRARLRNSFFGFVHQEYAIIDDLSIKANVGIPLEYSSPKLRRKQRDLLSKNQLLALGIDLSMHKRKANEVSGGQRQRVAIARALVNNPQVILADEPTAALDLYSLNTVMDLLHEAKTANKAILIATHDERVASRCDRRIVLDDGQAL